MNLLRVSALVYAGSLLVFLVGAAIGGIAQASGCGTWWRTAFGLVVAWTAISGYDHIRKSAVEVSAFGFSGPIESHSWKVLWSLAQLSVIIFALYMLYG